VIQARPLQNKDRDFKAPEAAMLFFQDLVRNQPDYFFATGGRPELLEPGAERDQWGFTKEKPRSRTCRADHDDVRRDIFYAGVAALGPDVGPTIDSITVNKNWQCRKHADKNASASYITHFGGRYQGEITTFSGGELVVENDRVLGGPTQVGYWQYFHGSNKHENRPHSGTRYAAIAYAKRPIANVPAPVLPAPDPPVVAPALPAPRPRSSLRPCSAR